MSDITKKNKKRYYLLKLISWALTIIPITVFLFMGMSTVDSEKKLILSFISVIAIILGVIMILTKVNLKRTIFWIVFIALYYCMSQLYILIIVMGGCTILDEIIIEPLEKHYKNKYKINKEIDKRL